MSFYFISKMEVCRWRAKVKAVDSSARCDQNKSALSYNTHDYEVERLIGMG